MLQLDREAPAHVEWTQSGVASRTVWSRMCSCCCYLRSTICLSHSHHSCFELGWALAQRSCSGKIFGQLDRYSDCDELKECAHLFSTLLILYLVLGAEDKLVNTNTFLVTLVEFSLWKRQTLLNHNNMSNCKEIRDSSPEDQFYLERF